MNTEQITKLLSMIRSFDILLNNSTEIIEKDLCIKLPLSWREDINGNINFDIDIIREMCHDLIESCEEYNEKSDFDFDNCE